MFLNKIFFFTSCMVDCVHCISVSSNIRFKARLLIRLGKNVNVRRTVVLMSNVLQESFVPILILLMYIHLDLSVKENHCLFKILHFNENIKAELKRNGQGQQK